MSGDKTTGKKMKKDAFAERLKSMARDGDLSFVLEDMAPATLSAKESRLLNDIVKKASLENRIAEARKALSQEPLSFGRHLQWIRNKCGIKKKDVAWALKKDVDFIDRLEAGRINPLKILENELIEIMQLFRIGISELIQTVKAYHTVSDSRTGYRLSMARSSFRSASDKKEEALSHAFDSVLLKAGEKGKTASEDIEIDEKYIEEIREELSRRREFELLE